MFEGLTVLKVLLIMFCALMALLWFYLLARLMSWAVAKSWCDFMRKYKQRKAKENEDE